MARGRGGGTRIAQYDAGAVSIDNDRSLGPSSIMLYSVVVGSDGHGNLADAMIV